MKTVDLDRTLALPSWALEYICCPRCSGDLLLEDAQFRCARSTCALIFPIADGIPIVLDEANSVFRTQDFLNRVPATLTSRRGLKKIVAGMIPDIGVNLKAKENYSELARLLTYQKANPSVLVVGGSIEGAGIRPLLSDSRIRIVHTDVSFGTLTNMICDAHNLPFQPSAFDAVVIQAVLEHVLEPVKCVSEIFRVLKDDGLVYAETPFMQQVHMGRYDFTRFTHLGHRRLFRQFVEIKSGAVCGPGMALAWSYQYFVLSFFQNKLLRLLATSFTRLTGFWLKYLDYYLIDKRGTLDAASGFFFLGRKSDAVMKDEELLEQYKGLI